MKNLRRMCAAMALTCILAVAVSAGDMLAGVVEPPPPPASAGDISAPGAVPPPPPQSAAEATAEGDIHAGGVIAVLLSLLSVF